MTQKNAIPASTHPAQPIRLFTMPLSGNGHRVRLFLSLLDLPCEIIEIDSRTGYLRQPEFLALNPLGQVPVIVDGDVVVYDSIAILVYLARKYADSSWLPADPAGMAHVQRWLALASGEIAYGPCAARRIKLFKEAVIQMDMARSVAFKLFDTIEPHFALHPFAAGNNPTIADISAYTYIAHADEGGISLEDYPNLRAWLRRIEALPRFVPMPRTV